MERKRIAYADVLRILSAFCLVLLHMSAAGWGAIAPNDPRFLVLTVLNALSRFCVPVFVALSGMFFLDPERELPLKRLFTKYIPRLAFAYLLFSGLYAWADGSGLNGFVQGHYHLWYLCMLAGLYLAAPVLRLMTRDKRLTEYFLVLTFFVVYLAPALLRLAGSAAWARLYDNFRFSLGLHFAFYFVAGAYLKRWPLGHRARYALYGLGFAGLCGTIWATWSASQEYGALFEQYLSFYEPGVCLFSLAVFVLVQQLLRGRTSGRMLTWAAGGAFGVYLLHDFFLMALRAQGIFEPETLSVWIISGATVLVFGISLGISLLLKQIPGIKRIL